MVQSQTYFKRNIIGRTQTRHTDAEVAPAPGGSGGRRIRGLGEQREQELENRGIVAQLHYLST